ncbi:MAG TPA: pyridoxamine 5'-phosphate oxidase family protein [Acidimicrobiales bacterium]|nr:pyridoxamine 5'-phosphate oxidase family protein [Acidimicrobiales bacterium]
MDMDVPRVADRRGPSELAIVELSEEECLRLLKTQDMGRLAVVVGGRPTIFPVNYAVDERLVVIRTDPGAKLEHAPLGWVAFEVDQFDPVSLSGWDVVVSGVARDVTDAVDETSTRLRAVEVVPWVTGEKAHRLAIFDATITGRRLVSAGDADAPPGPS